MTTEVFAVGGPELSRRTVFGGAVAGVGGARIAGMFEGVDHHNYERPDEREGRVQRPRRQDRQGDEGLLGPRVAVVVIADGEEYIKGYGVIGTPPLVDVDRWLAAGAMPLP
ncbi:hypothetical protein MLGJGCBP_02566 [Rhodococcus sp. T7]|nr:hypothetical protein MLGJGCBP_02566 [Rhodococcus sp. T7]